MGNQFRRFRYFGSVIYARVNFLAENLNALFLAPSDAPRYSGLVGKLRRMPWWAITLSLLATLVAVNLVASVFELYEEDAPIDIPDKWLMFGVVVIVVPLFETLVFQCGVVELFVRSLRFVSMRTRYAAGLVVSALLFGTSHWNIAVLMSVVGLVFAFNYIVFRRRGGVWYGVAMTLLLHAVYNAIACIGDLV